MLPPSVVGSMPWNTTLIPTTVARSTAVSVPASVTESVRVLSVPSVARSQSVTVDAAGSTCSTG